MDMTASILAVLAATLAWAGWHARKIGNETRDVALLGGIGGLCGAGAAVAVYF